MSGYDEISPHLLPAPRRQLPDRQLLALMASNIYPHVDASHTTRTASEIAVDRALWLLQAVDAALAPKQGAG